MLTADLSCWLASMYPMGALGEYTCIIGRPLGESLLEICGFDCVFVATMLVEMSVIGKGEVESDRELIPEVLDESVPLMLLCCTTRLSAGMGIGRTIEFETGFPEQTMEEVSATVLVVVGETIGAAMLVRNFW